MSYIHFNIAVELEKFSAGKKTSVGVEHLLHIAGDRYLENSRAARKRAGRIRRAVRSRVGNVIQFLRPRQE